MKSMIALGVGVVVALAPGTAFAAPADVNGTGQGHGYGNCSNSSAGGVHTPLDVHAGLRGNGGHVVKGVKVGCTSAPALPIDKPPVEKPVDAPLEEKPIKIGDDEDHTDSDDIN